MEDTKVKTKYCKHCGSEIDADAVICIKCGKQVEEIKQSNPNIIINNSNNNVNTNTVQNTTTGMNGKQKNKWIAFFLCLFTVCGHKFYEGKIGMGIVYLVTVGLFGIGWIIDLISLLFKSNPYYV